MNKEQNTSQTTETAIGYEPLLATGLISKKRVPWNYCKRKPEPDQDGELWCSCLNPKLVSNQGGRGQALCLLCGYPWYH